VQDGSTREKSRGGGEDRWWERTLRKGKKTGKVHGVANMEGKKLRLKENRKLQRVVPDKMGVKQKKSRSEGWQNMAKQGK